MPTGRAVRTRNSRTLIWHNRAAVGPVGPTPLRPSCRSMAGLSVRDPVAISTIKRVYRHISQSVCPWNRKFSVELADDSPFKAREFVAGKDATTLATIILALDQAAFSAAFRKSPMKRAKLAGLKRNAGGVAKTNDRSHNVLPSPALRAQRVPRGDGHSG